MFTSIYNMDGRYLLYGIKKQRKKGINHLNTKMSFEELCPIWSKKLKTGLTEKDKLVLARDSKYCLVGEAWGFSGRYTGYYIAPLIPIVGCWTCIKYGRQFGKVSRMKNMPENQFKPLIADFLHHWNEKHVVVKKLH
jgi:hypothetical protein